MSKATSHQYRYLTGLCALSSGEVQAGRKDWRSFSGAGFSFEFQPLKREAPDFGGDFNQFPEKIWDSFFPPEINILAPSQERADIASMLLYAAHAIMGGCVPQGPFQGWDPYQATLSLDATANNPVPQDPSESEPLRLQGSAVVGMAGLAARLSRRKALTEAAFSFLSSVYLYSFDPWNLHPKYGVGTVPRTPNPMFRVWETQALFAAYQVIEVLDLTVKGAGPEKPSIKDKVWNQEIRSNLEGRLEEIGISPEQRIVWVARGTGTKNQRKLGDRTSDSQPMDWNARLVHDESIPYVDAINRAHWLRSNVTAHRSAGRLEGHHPLDTYNVQMLARMLILKAARSPFLEPIAAR